MKDGTTLAAHTDEGSSAGSSTQGCVTTGREKLQGAQSSRRYGAQKQPVGSGEVIRTPAERTKFAEAAGRRRNKEAIEAGKKDAFGAKPEDAERNHVYGARAEQAFAKYVGINDWEPTFGEYGDVPDVLGFQVKRTHRSRPRLRIRRKTNGELPDLNRWCACVVEWRDKYSWCYWIAGIAKAGDVIQPKYWVPPRDDRPECWEMPVEDLIRLESREVEPLWR